MKENKTAVDSIFDEIAVNNIINNKTLAICHDRAILAQINELVGYINLSDLETAESEAFSEEKHCDAVYMARELVKLHNTFVDKNSRIEFCYDGLEEKFILVPLSL